MTEPQLFSDPGHVRDDLRLLRSAIKRRWPIPKSLRGLAVEKIKGILESSKDDRSIVAALRALIAADALNAKREETAVRKDSPVSINVGDGAKVQVIEVVAPVPKALDQPPPVVQIEVTQPNPGPNFLESE